MNSFGTLHRCDSSKPATRWYRAFVHLVCVVSVCLVSGPAAGQEQDQRPEGLETIALEELERGMKGYGYSVFAGTEPQRFEVEVVGKLENLNPGLSFLMANLTGEGLEETGVIAGMSGSPVYFDGRLAGAVAFSWNFSQGALAGITPIAVMRDLGQLPQQEALLPKGAVPLSVGSLPSVDPLNLKSGGSEDVSGGVEQRLAALTAGDFSPLLQRNLQWANKREELTAWIEVTSGRLTKSNSAGGAGVEGTRSAVQWLTTGFSEENRQLLAAGLPTAWAANSGSAAGKADPETALPPLQGGGPVAALLVSGDLHMAVNGTITERRGDEILAFGHPFLGVGPISLPMAKAEVVTVVSSRLSSFKLSNVGEVVGAFDEDRLAGMRGKVGAVADTTPLTVTVRHPQEGTKTFEMQMADLEAMRPMLVASSTLQSIERATRSAGAGGFDLRARFVVVGHEDLEIRQSFDGGEAAIDAAIYLLQVAAFIELSSLVDAKVESVDVEVDHYNAIRTETMVDAFADRRSILAGEDVAVRIKIRDYRGDERTETVTVPTPSDLKAGKYYLFVGDGISIDAARVRIEPAANRTFDEGLMRLGRLHSSKDLVVLGVQAERGVISQGGSLPALPGSMRALWDSSSEGQVKGTSLAVVFEQVLQRQRPLSGAARVDLTILPPKR